MKLNDLKGQQFGGLTVLQRSRSKPSWGRQRTAWLCRCVCGKRFVVESQTLTTGSTTSCGCLRTARIIKQSFRHGAAPRNGATPEYRAWQKAIARCENPNDGRYESYGGRGIRFHKAWRGSFQAFLDYMGPRPPGTSLDRIDNDGNYEPGNCRWATRSEQGLNTRDARLLTWNGETKNLSAWARELGIPMKRLHGALMYDDLPGIAARVTGGTLRRKKRVDKWRQARAAWRKSNNAKESG